MSVVTLKRRDGYADTSPELKEEVKKLQRALTDAGYRVNADGLFGADTQKAVEAFQRETGLVADGIVGPHTWKALRDNGVGDVFGLLKGFRGNLKWIHAREGHAGKAYWPGGASGVTLDPGVDLGHAKPELIEEAYKKLLTPDQMVAVKSVLGLKGEQAKATLDNSPVLKGIKISRMQADTIFQYAAKPYWDGIIHRFSSLASADTLPSVQTALLSLAYNRGVRNRALEILRQPLEEKRWVEVADIIGAMQQDHELEGVRKRRRMEAALIRNELT